MSLIDQDWVRQSTEIQLNSRAKLPVSQEVLDHAVQENLKRLKEEQAKLEGMGKLPEIKLITIQSS